MDEHGDRAGSEGFLKDEAREVHTPGGDTGPTAQTPGGDTGPTAKPPGEDTGPTGRRKWLWVVMAVLVGAIAAVFWPTKPEAPPQIITMPDGRKYEFVGVTYGTNHVMGSVAARLVSQLPGGATNWIQKHFGKWIGPLTIYNLTRPSPGALCVWFKPDITNIAPVSGTTKKPIIYSKLADENDIEGGTRYDFFLPNSNYPLGEFSMVPRRSKVLHLCFYYEGTNQAGPREIGRVRFPNPLYGHFPEWQAEAVPAVKKAGDLEVHLEKFVSGLRVGNGDSIVLARGQKVSNYRPGRSGERIETIFDLTLDLPSGRPYYWLLKDITLSDPGGNCMNEVVCRGLYPGFHEDRIYLNGTMWPNEAALRLKLEFYHAAPYAAEELVRFKDVPLPKIGTTSKLCISNAAAGRLIVLTELKRNTGAVYFGWPSPPPSHICIDIPGSSNGMAVYLTKMTTDTGKEIDSLGNAWSALNHTIGCSVIPTNAQTVDITLAVQKMRSVEFLVKPPK